MTEKTWLENFWGWGGNPPELRVALPPTELYPEETRLHGLVLPPYIATWQRGDKIEIDLWEGRGCRVGLDHETEDASQCIYADAAAKGRSTGKVGITVVKCPHIADDHGLVILEYRDWRDLHGVLKEDSDG